MRLFVTILVLLQVSIAFSQIDFESESNKTQCFPWLTPKVRELNRDFDFQLRLWKYDSLFPFHKKLFTLTLQGDKWRLFGFDLSGNAERNNSIKKTRMCKENGDCIWNYFLANNVLQLPDMDMLKKDFCTYQVAEYKKNKPILPPKEVEDSLMRNNAIEPIEIVAKGLIKKQLFVFDGPSYYLELISKNRYKRIEYYSPHVFAEAYRHIPELQNFSNILKKVEEVW